MQSWRSEVPSGFPWPQIKVSAGLCPEGSRGESPCLPDFRGRSIPWIAAPPPSKVTFCFSRHISPHPHSDPPASLCDTQAHWIIQGHPPPQGPYLSHLCWVPLPSGVRTQFPGIRVWTSLGPSLSLPQGCQLLTIWFLSRLSPLPEHLYFPRLGWVSTCPISACKPPPL